MRDGLRWNRTVQRTRLTFLTEIHCPGANDIVPVRDAEAAHALMATGMATMLFLAV